MEDSLLQRLGKDKKDPGHTPDVLSCLANLSNDEVFTPPEIVNQMLDMLPQELFTNPETKFLDPACKTGVFLREIAKRLLVGLEDKIPDLQQRIDHIFHNQLYGIAITELTSLLSRRSVYCSKYPNGKYSVSKFDNAQGNIRFKKVNHKWKGGRCIYCGANMSEYDRELDKETYAYEFIHDMKIEEVYKMKFDVIIGNPPYQLNTGGAQAQAIPLYHKFVIEAKKMEPRYLCMITPSRWFTGGFGLDGYRKNMLEDRRLRKIIDYPNASECFPGVEIKGGVNYFLWDREHPGKCLVETHIDGKVISSMERELLENNLDIFIRYNEAVPIYRKVSAFKERPLTEIISSQRPFGLPTNFNDMEDIKHKKNDFLVYANKKTGYISHTYPITKNGDLIPKYKVLTPKAIGSGNASDDWVKPILAEPNTVCTETYIVLGAFDTKEEAQNLIAYTQTQFFHFMLTLRKNTQDALQKAYSLIPLQNCNENWNDEKLFKKYNLTEKEIEFIKSTVRKIPTTED